jgi:hypothetical protein
MIPLKVRGPMPPSSEGTCWAIGTVGPGSAGASTVAVTLATCLNGILVEADADGGVLGSRYGAWLSDSAPSLTTLLATLRTDLGPGSIENHVQHLPSGVRAILLPPDVDRALGPVGRLVEDLDLLLQRLPGERVILDVGRVRPDTPSMMLTDLSDALIVVVRPEVESLTCLMARLPTLVEQIPRLVIAVRGEGSYSVADIRASIEFRTSTGIPVVSVPEDPRGVKALSQADPAERALWMAKRSGTMMHAARVLAAKLDALGSSTTRREPHAEVNSPAGTPFSRRLESASMPEWEEERRRRPRGTR